MFGAAFVCYTCRNILVRLEIITSYYVIHYPCKMQSHRSKLASQPLILDLKSSALVISDKRHRQHFLLNRNKNIFFPGKKEKAKKIFCFKVKSQTEEKRIWKRISKLGDEIKKDIKSVAKV